MKCKVCGKIEDKCGWKCSMCFRLKRPVPGYYTEKKIERLEKHIGELHTIIEGQDAIICQLRTRRNPSCIYATEERYLSLGTKIITIVGIFALLTLGIALFAIIR